MSSFLVSSPLESWGDDDGTPLEDGYIYIGTYGLNPETNEIDVFWDDAGNIPAAQPIRTIGGYPSRQGKAAVIYSGVGEFSQTVRNKKRELVYSDLYQKSAANNLLVISDGRYGPIFATVATMTQINPVDINGNVVILLAGMSARTQGRNAPGDSGGGDYLMEALNSPDGYGYIALGDGVNQASLQTIAFASSEQFGVKSDGVTDDTAAQQAAMNFCFDRDIVLYSPAGLMLTTGLRLPGRVDGGVDDRNKTFKWYGQGTGEPLSLAALEDGTTIISVTDAPVLQDYLDLATASNGANFIEGIRFHGDSATTPVVKLQSFFGQARMNNCVIYQGGVGDGVEIGRSALVKFNQCFSFNVDWATSVLGAARTGVAWNFITTADVGLVTFNQCSGRGFKDAFVIDGVGGQKALATRIVSCQASVTYNAVRIEIGNNTVIDNLYCEGGDGGTGITDGGDYTTITESVIGVGYLVGIDASDTTTKGTVIENNTVSMGSLANSIGIHAVSSAAFGGYNKTVDNNSIIYTAGTAGVNGIKLEGTAPRLSVTNNTFNPKTAWSGTGTLKINDLSTGIFGQITKTSGNYDFPYLSQGGISLFRDAPTLTETDVAANILTVADGLSYSTMTATVATTVQRLDMGAKSGFRILMIRTINANTTFQDTAFLSLDGAVSFTGPGTLTLGIDVSGGNDYAYEISRAVY